MDQDTRVVAIFNIGVNLKEHNVVKWVVVRGYLVKNVFEISH